MQVAHILALEFGPPAGRAADEEGHRRIYTEEEEEEEEEEEGERQHVVDGPQEGATFAGPGGDKRPSRYHVGNRMGRSPVELVTTPRRFFRRDRIAIGGAEGEDRRSL